MTRLWSSGKYAEASAPARLCIVLYAVEEPQDAMIFWMDEYAGSDVCSSMIRDLWIMVCEYAISPDPIPSQQRKIVANWYHIFGCVKQFSNCAKDNEFALWAYNRAISFNGGQWQGILVDRSFTYSKLNRFTEALLDADSSFDAKGNLDWPSCLAKGDALFGLGRYQTALTYLEIALHTAEKTSFRFPSITQRIDQIKAITSTSADKTAMVKPDIAKTDIDAPQKIAGAKRIEPSDLTNVTRTRARKRRRH